MRPRYEQQLVSDDGRFITQWTEFGVLERVFKSSDEMSMPEHIEYPVKTREDWNALKPRFAPGDEGRFPAGWSERCARWRADGPVLVFQTRRAPSLFGFVRELIGPERTLYAFYDEPELVHDIMETQTELVLSLLPRVIKDAPLSGVFFWEDMCYRSGPLISPAMFRRFMLPRYKRITERARSLGVDIIFVDSDGNLNQLIPLWLESGINFVWPLEVAAGNDAVELRKKYGKDLILGGNLDKRALLKGRDAIRQEVMSKVPYLLEQGGYFPSIDHFVPPDATFEAYLYFINTLREIGGLKPIPKPGS